MLDHDIVQQVRRASCSRRVNDAVARYHAGAPVPLHRGWADKDSLRVVPCGLRGDTSRPHLHRLVEPLALPPIGISPGQVHGPLGPTSDSLAELVACHEQAIRMFLPRGVELGLFSVGAVAAELIPRVQPVQCRQDRRLLLR